MSEQPDGDAARSAGAGRAFTFEARERGETTSAGDAERHVLGDALRFLDASDDPEPFAGQFDPFDGFRAERDEDRSGPPAVQFGSIHPPSRQPDAGRRAAGSISAEEIERLEQEMMEIDASWGGCEPEPVSRTDGEQGQGSSQRTGDGESSSDALPVDAEAAQHPPSSQAVPESTSSAAAPLPGAAPPQSGGCDSETAGSLAGNAGSDAAIGSEPDFRPGGRDRESLRAASPEAHGLEGVPGQSVPRGDAPFGFGNGGDTLEPSADEKNGNPDPDAESRAFDEVGARMAIRNGTETGGGIGNSCASPLESGTPGEVRSEACEAKSESGSGSAVPPDPDCAVSRDVSEKAGSGPSQGAIEESGPDQVDRADQPAHRPASGLPIKAAVILAAGVAASAGMLAFDQLDIASRLGLARIPAGSESATPHGTPETSAEPGGPRGALRSAAGTPSVTDSSTASSIAVPARSLANAASESRAALRSSGGSLISVAGAGAAGKAEAVERTDIAADPAASLDGPSFGSGTGSADGGTFPVAGGSGMDIGDDINSFAMHADAETGREEFGPPFGFTVAGNAETVRLRSGRAAESSQQSSALTLPQRKPSPGSDPVAEGCLSNCEAPEAHPNTAAQPPQAAEAVELIASRRILPGSRLEGAARYRSVGVAGRIDGIDPESARGVSPSNAFASGDGFAEGGAVGRVAAPADADERINRKIAELRVEVGGVSRSLQSRIDVIESKLEELGKALASRHESSDGPSAAGEAETPSGGSLGTRAGMADELTHGAAVRSVPERAGSYVIAAEVADNACSRTRPPRIAPGAEGFGCGRVLDVVSDGLGGWLVVTENAVIRLD